jgi:hypothetical protein
MGGFNFPVTHIGGIRGKRPILLDRETSIGHQSSQCRLEPWGVLWLRHWDWEEKHMLVTSIKACAIKALLINKRGGLSLNI